MHSTFYVCLSALWFAKLSIDVIKIRRKYQIRIGDGGQQDLLTAQRVQGNCAEYMPITLILLVVLELNASPVWVIHLFGIGMIGGRMLHARALQTDDISMRVKGMQLTFLTIISLAAANLIVLFFSNGGLTQ